MSLCSRWLYSEFFEFSDFSGAMSLGEAMLRVLQGLFEYQESSGSSGTTAANDEKRRFLEKNPNVKLDADGKYILIDKSKLPDGTPKSVASAQLAERLAEKEKK